MTPIPTHKALAIGLFRSSVFLVFAIGAFAEHDEKLRTTLVTMIFMLDVISWHICEVTNINAHVVYNQTWFNVLADRFLLEKLFDRVRDREHVDFPELIKEGTKAAGADIEKFLNETTVWARWGGFKKMLAGAGLFVWYWVSYGLFYGFAFFVGSMLRAGY